MTGWLSTALLAAMASGRPANPVQKPHAMAASPQAGANFTLNVTPAAIAFAATNPGTIPVVAGSAVANASWTALSLLGGNWSLSVQAAAPTFANCSTVPVSAVTVSCASVSVVGLGGSGTCTGSFPLSTTPQIVASGSTGIVSLNYSITIAFTLADSWQYIAEMSPACTLSLTYTANVP
ncbi:MAG: hypothetical protein ABSH56_01115 [Bryobacteraceae bacterium]|jgi:hypothetical protein